MNRTRSALAIVIASVCASVALTSPIRSDAESAAGSQFTLPTGFGDSALSSSAATDTVDALLVKTTSDSAITTRQVERSAESALPEGTDVQHAASGSALGTTVLTLDSAVDLATAQETADQLQQQPGVEWAVPNVRFHAADVPSPYAENDTYYGTQYNLWDSMQASGGYGVKAAKLWPATKGRGVVVAVLDTGITSHPDLDGQTVPGYDFVSDPTEARDGNGRDPDPTDPGTYASVGDCNGDVKEAEPSSWHGTHVAGIIAAKAGNGQGIAGVGPELRIQPVRVLGECGGTLSDLVAGIVWAAGLHVNGVPNNPTPAKVINLSLGQTFLGNTAKVASICKVMAEVSAAVRARGATLVTAAGNDSGLDRVSASVSVPVGCPGFYGVGSVSRTGHRAYYSNIGGAVDISTPGGDSLTDPELFPQNVSDAQPGGDNLVLSTINNGATTATDPGYVRYEGTSMATPQVAAAAALIYSLGVRKPSTVEAILSASVSPFAPRTSYGLSDWSNVRFQNTTTGQVYSFNLMCSTGICGAGVLNLAKVPAPTDRARITGSARPGRVLAAHSQWTRSTKVVTTWYVRGRKVHTGARYRVKKADRGKSVYVVVAPKAKPYNVIRSVSVKRVIRR